MAGPRRWHRGQRDEGSGRCSAGASCFSTARRSLHVDLAALAAGLCNDMVGDAAGRAYVGNFGYDRHNNARVERLRQYKLGPIAR